MLQKTTAQSKIAKLKKRIRIVQGGTSSSKTFTILPFLIQYAIQTPNSEISVVSESIPHLKRGALKDFLKIMDWTNNFNPNNFNKSNLTYKFSNGSYIEFFSADQPDKLRGARRDVLFINECNNVTFESYQQLAIRTKKFIYLDYNPTNEFWVHTELINDINSDFVILTYKDNEALDPAIVKEIEKAKAKAETSTYWDNWWKVYGLGQIGSLDGVIFNNWQTIDTIPNDARLLGYGLDFGYTNDPTAIVEVYKWNDQRILNEICYLKELSNSQIAKYINTRLPVYCDSAEPKSIAELKRLGMNAYGVTKGSDSINFGIQTMQEQSYFITSQSTNLIDELRKYAWDKDRRTGAKLNKPIDDFNHCFVASTLITTKNGQIKINEIKVGDLVLTSQGYKRVLKTFDNGYKETTEYSLLLDNYFISLQCTDNHKFKTTQGWQKVKNLTEGHIIYITESVISQKEQKDCTGWFGNSIMGKYPRDFIFITKTIIQKITKLKIWNWSMLKNIFRIIQRNSISIIQTLLLIKCKKINKNVENGTQAKKELNNIENKQLNQSLGTLLLVKENVNVVAKNMKQRKVNKNFAQIIAKQSKDFYQELIMKKELAVNAEMNLLPINIAQKNIVKIHTTNKKEKEKVYDLMIEDCHEYFANGVLVHNCIDAVRYHEMETLGISKNRSLNVKI